MIRALFVSDIHITSPSDRRHELFIEFLDRCRRLRPTHLFLVGDIFDFWIADRRYFLRRYQRIIQALRELRMLGVQLHYFEGNHDLDLRVFWERDLGAFVHENAVVFPLGQRRLRVEHGDQMDPEDRGYLFLRWLLRTSVVRWLGRNLPESAVRWIGERASKSSRAYTSSPLKAVNDDVAREKVRRHALRVWKQDPFDILVSGHVHVRLDDVLRPRDGRAFRCINLGTWIKEPLVLMFDGEKAELVRMQNI